MAAMRPTLLRIGNYLEGRYDSGAIQLEEDDRAAGGQAGAVPARGGTEKSDGLGLLDSLEWCEDLKMQPLLAVYAGYGLQRRRRV